jgi:hypothetical protein
MGVFRIAYWILLFFFGGFYEFIFKRIKTNRIEKDSLLDVKTN